MLPFRGRNQLSLGTQAKSISHSACERRRREAILRFRKCALNAKQKQKQRQKQYLYVYRIIISNTLYIDHTLITHVCRARLRDNDSDLGADSSGGSCSRSSSVTQHCGPWTQRGTP